MGIGMHTDRLVVFDQGSRSLIVKSQKWHWRVACWSLRNAAKCGRSRASRPDPDGIHTSVSTRPSTACAYHLKQLTFMAIRLRLQSRDSTCTVKGRLWKTGNGVNSQSSPIPSHHARHSCKVSATAQGLCRRRLMGPGNKYM
jgi:hypothetical protein